MDQRKEREVREREGKTGVKGKKWEGKDGLEKGKGKEGVAREEKQIEAKR